MLGLIVDPVSGEPLGMAPKRKPASVATRIEDRVSRLPVALSDEEREAELARIEAEEQSRQYKQAAPVAGFDLTFSPSKSVSVAWALADQGTKAVIYECHRRAIEYTVAYAERERLPLPIREGRCRPRGRVRGGCCSVHPLRQSLRRSPTPRPRGGVEQGEVGKRWPVAHPRQPGAVQTGRDARRDP